MPDQRHAQLVAWLQDRGHSAEEIDRILAKVAEYDDRTARESVFDSIETGGFDLQGLIDEALADHPPKD
ncbi:MAG: hypothetical protein AAF805_07400 [Planctomycetota bacterium]